MPELPEVETVRRGLIPRMVGHRIVRLTQRRKDLRVALPARFAQKVEGRTILAPDGTRIQVTVSLGVAAFPEHAGAGEALLHAADVALYRAKREGRDRVVVSESLPPAPPATPGSAPAQE